MKRLPIVYIGGCAGAITGMDAQVDEQFGSLVPTRHVYERAARRAPLVTSRSGGCGDGDSRRCYRSLCRFPFGRSHVRAER
jgi:hypothetical protein